MAGVSSLLGQVSDPWDDRPWHSPDIAVELSAEDDARGRDPVLDEALTAVAARPGRSAASGSPRRSQMLTSHLLQVRPETKAVGGEK